MEYDPNHFEVDGALRDISVLDIGIQEWELMMSALPELGAMVALEIDSESSPEIWDPAELFSLLESDDDASAKLTVEVGGIEFRCYFYRVCEIEFTFDPGSVGGVEDFASLEKFIRWLGESCRRRVSMTMEGVGGAPFPALLEYDPQG
ncbi:hypothetical protein [Kitasatospora sp. NPDC001225]